MALVERQKSKDLETLRRRNHRRVGEADFEVAVLIEQFGGTDDVDFLERHDLELFALERSNEVAGGFDSKLGVKQVVDFSAQHDRYQKIARFKFNHCRRRG